MFMIFSHRTARTLRTDARPFAHIDTSLYRAFDLTAATTNGLALYPGVYLHTGVL